MLHFLLAVHFLLALSIIGLILLQKHDSDGALGSSGGGAAGGMFSVRGQANILTKSTAVLMTIFALNCLVLAKMVKSAPAKGSVIDRVAEEQLPGTTPLADLANQKIAQKKAENAKKSEQKKETNLNNKSAKGSESSPAKK
jgi:preprotein translocase subunit SecG